MTSAIIQSHQLSEQQWLSLIGCFEMWLDEQWRDVTLGNNKTKPSRVREIVRMMYQGRRCREIVRRTTSHSVTVKRIHDHLFRFLADSPEFPKPRCACGESLWHRGICPVWDTYHAKAIAKGHVTQRRRHRENQTVAFFSAVAATNTIGQYQRQKQRELIRREMLEMLESRPDMDRDAVIASFSGRGFNRCVLSRILNLALEHPAMLMRTYNVAAPKSLDLNHADIFQTTNAIKHMTTTIEMTKTHTDAQQFATLVQQGINAWTEAGRLLVQMLDENPQAKNIIIELCPDITEEILSRFEAIGRKQLHPKTLLNNSPGMRRLRHLPFSDQERFLTEPVPVLVKTDSGVDTLNVAVKNLTTEQAAQVLGPTGVRSLEAQRAWVESRGTRKHAPRKPYQIKGHKVIFHADCEMTARELAQVLSQIS